MANPTTGRDPFDDGDVVFDVGPIPTRSDEANGHFDATAPGAVPA